jgi:hypothetical protein
MMADPKQSHIEGAIARSGDRHICHLTTRLVVVDELRSLISINNSNKKMTRIAHLEPYLSEPELKHRQSEATNSIEARRWQLLWLISLSKTIKGATAVIEINYDSIREIVKGYNQQGQTAIHQKKQPPKKRPSHALLNAQQLEELRLRLKGESPNRGLGERTQTCIMELPKIW